MDQTKWSLPIVAIVGDTITQRNAICRIPNPTTHIWAYMFLIPNLYRPRILILTMTWLMSTSKCEFPSSYVQGCHASRGSSFVKCYEYRHLLIYIIRESMVHNRYSLKARNRGEGEGNEHTCECCQRLATRIRVAHAPPSACHYSSHWLTTNHASQDQTSWFHMFPFMIRTSPHNELHKSTFTKDWW